MLFLPCLVKFIILALFQATQSQLASTAQVPLKTFAMKKHPKIRLLVNAKKFSLITASKMLQFTWCRLYVLVEP